MHTQDRSHGYEGYIWSFAHQKQAFDALLAATTTLTSDAHKAAVLKEMATTAADLNEDVDVNRELVKAVLDVVETLAFDYDKTRIKSQLQAYPLDAQQ